MTVRNVGGAILGLMLVLGASACDDNPLAEDRDKAAYFRLNPVDVGVNAGGSVLVEAIVVNKYGAATNAAVNATPCDNRITAAVDTTRTAYEFPERFEVTGVSLGVSCLIVKGGGLTDTVRVRVVPSQIQITGADVLLSGATTNVQVQFLSMAGTPVTGFSIADVSLSTGNASIATITPTGEVTAYAPGSTTITATLDPQYGVTRTGTAAVEVTTGPFTGTVSPQTAGAGELLTLTAGAVPFDGDTQLQIGGQPAFIESSSANEIVAVVPAGLTGTVSGILTNLGPAQLAVSFDLPITSDVVSTGEPANNDYTTAPAIPNTTGANIYGSVASNDAADLYQLVVPAGGATYTVRLDWPGNADADVIWRNAAGTFMGYGAPYGGCATAANHPENCTITLAEGTWYLWIDLYDAGSLPATLYQLRVTQQP